MSDFVSDCVFRSHTLGCRDVNSCIMCRRVSWILVVSEQSCSLSVVMCIACFVFPQPILYIAFQGLVAEVKLQNSIHDLLFSRLMAAAYSDFETKYFPFLCSRILLSSFVAISPFCIYFFICVFSRVVHQGVGLSCRAFPADPVCVSEDLQASSCTSWSSSTAAFMFSNTVTLWHQVSSN